MPRLNIRTYDCSIEGCGRPGYARGWCEMHYQRWRANGDPRVSRLRDPRTDDPGYGSAHDRVRRTYGKASERDCVDCGQQAAHWAYDRADPLELVDARGYAYSASPVHYQPRCVPCHSEWDRR